MPYSSMTEVPAQIKKHQDIPLTLAQCNKWAEIFDAIKAQGKAESEAAPMAWATWEKMHEMQDGKWVEKKMDMSTDLETIKDVEIFETGEWNGHNVTEKDLEDMANAHKEIGHLIKPYLKLGHNTQQTLLANDGLPAAGWIENVRKKGQKLVADFVDVPRAVAKVIKNKGYRRVSSEVYRNFILTEKETGTDQRKIYPRVLGAVALLGANLPAVTKLSDILTWYGNNQLFSSDLEKDVFNYDLKEENEMTPEEIQKAIQDGIKASMEAFTAAQKTEFDKKNGELDTKLAEFTKKEEALTAKEKEVEVKAAKFSKLEAILDKVENADALAEFINNAAKEREELATKQKAADEVITKAQENEVNSFVSEMITSGKLVPAQSDMAKQLLFSAQRKDEKLKFTKTVADIGLKEEMSLFDTMKAFIKSLPDRKILDEFSANGKNIDGDVNAERRKLVDEYQKQHKVDYAAAQLAVKKVRPDLFEADSTEE